MTAIAWSYGIGPIPFAPRLTWRSCAFLGVLCLVLGLLCGTACACGGSHPSPAPQTVSARAIARGSVETFETVWLLSERACKQIAQVRDDTVFWQKCGKVLLPADSALLATSAMVDGWTDADQKNIPCALQDLVVAFENIQELLQEVKSPPPVELAQAFELARSLVPMCVRPDAGVSDAGEGG